jgi:hypothetical protein
MRRRMYQPSGPISPPSAKGMRHPQACIDDGEIKAVAVAPTSAATNAAAPWLAPRQLARKQRRPGPANSMRAADAGPISPPAASPCVSLAHTIRTVAAMPIDAYGGRKAISQVPSAISEIDSARPALRPRLSATLPISIAPSGRITKPAPKVASEISRDAEALPAGKNSRPMIPAEKLYTVKS